ncbi:MAG: Gfo/Idh/MocA family oxidoreductase, partial [Candidatus Competibacteraceae bacterium]|nr:Gfo/Idh/MocA family oxidoreductase [Candidatus Competibacteraceae bacterium]
MTDKIRVLVVGMGNMGVSHAKAYHHLDGFKIVGLCSRNLTAQTELPAELADYPRFDNYARALSVL